MDLNTQALVGEAITLFEVYVIPYVWTVTIALVTVAFGFNLSKKNGQASLKRAVREEIRTNSYITKTLTQYAEKQLTSDPSVQPMPRFHDSAYREYKRAGLLGQLRDRQIEELENLYIYMESVNEAGRRQEDLSFGPSAAYPNASQLRIENLTYIHDTTYNVIRPYCERLQHTRL